MAVSNENNIKRYAGNGSQTVFPYDFKIFAETDLVVLKYTIADGTKVTLALTTDYTVSGIGVDAGGNVTLTGAAPSSLYKIIIYRELPLTQTMDLVESASFPAENVEAAHDRSVMIAQQQQEQIDRSIKIDEAQTGVDLTLPMPVAKKGLKWNDDGDAIVNTNEDIDDLAVQSEAARDAAVVAQNAAQASAVAAAASAVAASGASLIGTSTTSFLIGTGSKTFTTQTGKMFQAGQFVMIVDTSNPSNWMFGQVTSYSGTTLIVNVLGVGGSGTISSWNIIVSGTAGATGSTGAAGDGLFNSSPILAKTANYTLVAADRSNLITCSGTFTLTLPAIVGGYVYKIENTGAGTITLAPNGAETSEVTSLTAGQSVILIGDSVNTIWRSVARNGGGGSTDEKVKNASADASAGYLIEKLAALYPVLYQRDVKWALKTPWSTAANRYTVQTPNRLSVDINGTVYFLTAQADIDLSNSANWDSIATDYRVAATRAGKNFYIYACVPGSGATPVILLSANSTTPTGYSSTTSRKIGGFHCLCVAVGTISGHTLTGFVAGDVLPTSIWDLNHKPKNANPEGMVYSISIDKWVDIYLASGTGSSTASVNAATISDTRNWMDFVDDGMAVNKRMLNDPEFSSIAAGSNEETNITGSADPGATTGHTDTAGRRMISNIGCEDCCGALYQWLSDQSSMNISQAAGYYDLPGAKGSMYRPANTEDVKLLAGGSWSDATNAGSRCRCANNYRWGSSTVIGCRFCAEPVLTS